MKAFYALTHREQLMLLGGAAVLIIAGLWLYVWQPLRAEQALQSDRISRYLTLLEIVQGTNDTAHTRITPAVDALTPLAPRITQSAKAADIAIARLDPEGDRLRLTVAKADFAVIIQWIASLEAAESIRAVSIEIARLTEPGQVSMRITVEDAR